MNISSVVSSEFLERLPTDLRRKVYFIIPCIAVVAIIELGSVAIAVPFFTVVMDAGHFFNDPIYAKYLALADIVSEQQLLAVTASLFCTIVALSALIRFLLFWFQTSLAFEIGRYLGCSIYEASLWQSYENILNHSSDEVISTISFKVERSVKEIILPSFIFMTSCVSLAAIISVLATISYGITFGILAAFGVFYFTIRWFTKDVVIESGEIVAKQSTGAIKIAREGYLGFKDIILNQSRQFYGDLFVNAYTRFKKAQVKIALIAAVPKYLVEGLVLVTAGITVFIFSSGGENFASVIPFLSAFGIAAMRALPLVQSTYNSLTTMSAGMINLQETVELLNRNEKRLLEAKGKSPLPICFEQQIELRDVSFKYAGTDEWVFKNLNLTIKKGDQVGIVGQTGGGKSTLLSMLMGFLYPTSGRVLVDGIELLPERIAAWQEKVAHVPQNIFLLDTTIAENIAFGQRPEDIDLSLLNEVMKRAAIDDLVDKKTDSVWSRVGENGSNLSGGQRQRLALARAYYKGAEIIVLDEATSALDEKTERSALEWITSDMNNATVIKVAHRVNTLKSCDVILQLKDGEITSVTLD